eukprot:8125106-Heterocapsa_arctica.AAC.1
MVQSIASFEDCRLSACVISQAGFITCDLSRKDAGFQRAVSKILRHKQTISETIECMALEPLSVAEQHMLSH